MPAVNEVAVVDLTTMQATKSVPVCADPQEVLVRPDGKAAYVANAQSNSVSVVDLKTLKEVTRIPVGQVPKRNITALLP